MAIIPIIFFALLFGFGSIFSSTGEATVTQQATPVSPSEVTLPSDGAHALFTTRDALPSCDSWSCLQDAADQGGNGAELVRTSTTSEGDPIRTYYRVKPGGEYEIFTDRSQDKNLGNGPAWSYEVCAVPEDVSHGCTGS